MKREISKKLATWKTSKNRLPLILSGARQVGKTYILKDFGQKHFKNFHYLNFEDRKDLGLIFEQDFEVKRIVAELELKLKTTIDIEHDLLIFDEIQNSPNALTSLKYFAENLPKLAVCAAGSLLGVTLSEASFPVGKVDRLWLGPLNFKEFLLGIGADKELAVLEEACQTKSMSKFVHKTLWEKFNLFAVVGGLPAAVKIFSDNDENLAKALESVRNVQNNLIKDYLADVAKHSGKVNALHIQLVLESIPTQLGKNLDAGMKKYLFKDVIPGKKGYANFHGPISWLEKAGLVYKLKICNQPSFPLDAYSKDNVFKLYLFDTGLLGALSGIPISVMYQDQYGQAKGALAENVVLQLMLKDANHQIYSWQQNTSEIEFLRMLGDEIVPVEVKASFRTKAKSLMSYVRRYGQGKAVVLSNNVLNIDTAETVLNVPTYLAGDLERLVEGEESLRL